MLFNGWHQIFLCEFWMIITKINCTWACSTTIKKYRHSISFNWTSMGISSLGYPNLTLQRSLGSSSQSYSPGVPRLPQHCPRLIPRVLRQRFQQGRPRQRAQVADAVRLDGGCATSSPFKDGDFMGDVWGIQWEIYILYYIICVYIYTHNSANN